jgi:formiminotetrahydrofolate cyclodeaminase
MTEREKEIWNLAIKTALMEAAKIPTTNLQKCITYWQIEILQLEEGLKK